MQSVAAWLLFLLLLRRQPARMFAATARRPCSFIGLGATKLHPLLQKQLLQVRSPVRFSSPTRAPTARVTRQLLQQQQQQQRHHGVAHPAGADSVAAVISRFVAACRSFERHQGQQREHELRQQRQAIEAGTAEYLLAARAAVAAAPVACIQAALQAVQQQSLPLSLLLPIADAFYAAAEERIQQEEDLALLNRQQQQQQQRQSAEDLLQLALLLQPRAFVLGGKQQQQQIEELLLLLPPQTRQRQKQSLKAALQLLARLLLRESPLLLRESVLARALLQASDQGLQHLVQHAAANSLRDCTENRRISSSCYNARVALGAALLRSCAAGKPSKEVVNAAVAFLTPAAAAAAAESRSGSEYSLQQQQQQLAAWCDVAAALCMKLQQAQLLQHLLPAVQAAICASLCRLQQRQQQTGVETVDSAARQLEPAAAALVLVRARAAFAADAARAAATGGDPAATTRADRISTANPNPKTELFSRALKGLAQQHYQRQQQERSGELAAAVSALQEAFLRLWRQLQQQQQQQQQRRATHRPHPSSPFSCGTGSAEDAAAAAAVAKTVGTATEASTPTSSQATTDLEAVLLGLLQKLLLLADIPQQQQLSEFLNCISREVLPACDLQQALLLLQCTVQLLECSQLQQQQHQPTLHLGSFVDSLLLAVVRGIKRHKRDNSSSSTGSSSRLRGLGFLADTLFSPSLKRHLLLPGCGSDAADAAASALVDQLQFEIQLLHRQQHLGIKHRVALQEQVVLAVLRTVCGAHSVSHCWFVFCLLYALFDAVTDAASCLLPGGLLLLLSCRCC